jgi:hypothetical protein
MEDTHDGGKVMLRNSVEDRRFCYLEEIWKSSRVKSHMNNH